MTNKKAVIYTREAMKQDTHDFPNRQDTRAHEYARLNDYEVVAVFSDVIPKNEDAKPDIESMLAFIDSRRPDVVIIDEVTKLTREEAASQVLRAAIAYAGGVVVLRNSESERAAVCNRVPPEESPADVNQLLWQQQPIWDTVVARGYKIVSASHDNIKTLTDQ